MTPDEIMMEFEEGLEGALRALTHELAKIRTGRANTAILDGIDVDCYGGKSSLAHVANLSVPEPRLIVIQPYDRTLIKAIETALQKADIGITPNNDGSVIRLPIPELTEDRRKDLVKIVKRLAEEGRVSIRNHRHHANDLLKKGEKSGDIPQDEAKKGLDDVQSMTEDYNTKVDELLAEKEKEIMTV